ncbi:MAG TPA: DUF692 family protein [Bryobacteraceae bacterium]|nr:DUF692 family protein [Bryobacteraceae bacterium]
MRFTPPRLGPGAIYLRSLDSFFRSNGDLIRVAEVEPQTLWTKATTADAIPAGSPAERRHLGSLPQRVLTHGVGYPIGGTICDQKDHISEFRLWNRELSVCWTSEHLSVLHVRAGSRVHSCGFLMPPIQTDSGVRLAAQNIIQRRAALDLPFAFETGVNYFSHRDDELPDGEFFAAVAEEADCGILLDLTNLWINQKNGRAKISDILSRLPLERVWEVHLAGVEIERGYWVDAHSREIDPELVAFTAEILPSLPNPGAIIFELAPERVSSFGERAYLREIEVLNRLWEKVPPREASAPAAPDRRRKSNAGDIGPTPEQWEEVFALRMLPECCRTDAAATYFPCRSADEESFSLYCRLAESFRSGALAELLGNTIHLLLLALGKDPLKDFIAAYVAATPPARFPTDEVVQFQNYLKQNPLPIAGLDDILKFEASLIEAAANNTIVRLTLNRDIDRTLADLAADRIPGPSLDRPPFAIEIGVDPVPFIRAVPEEVL